MERKEYLILLLKKLLETHIETTSICIKSETLLKFQKWIEILEGRKPPVALEAFQSPEICFPELDSQAWFEINLPIFSWTQTLEQNYEAIRQEYNSLVENHPHTFAPYTIDPHSIQGAPWNAFYLIRKGKPVEENIKLCPKTFSIIEKIPRIGETAMFSVLHNGAHIKPHCGPWNCRLTFHLGLQVPNVSPQECGIKVADKTKQWHEGKMLAFDDSFFHEAWNKSSSIRVILLLDIWHPNLADDEVELLQLLCDMEQDYLKTFSK